MPRPERPIQAEFEKYCPPRVTPEVRTMMEGAFYGGAIGVFTLLMEDPLLADRIVADLGRYGSELGESLKEAEPCPSPSVKPS